MILENKALSTVKIDHDLLDRIMIFKIYIKLYITEPFFIPQHDFVNSLNRNIMQNVHGALLGLLVRMEA